MKKFALYFLLVCVAHFTFAQTKTTTIVAPDAGTGAGQGTFPQAINMHGEIGGFYVDANNVTHGFLRSSATNFLEWDAPSSSSTMVSDMNWHGFETGWYVPSPASNQGAVIGFMGGPGGIKEFILASRKKTVETHPLAINLLNGVAGYWLDPASKTNPNPQCFTSSGGVTFALPNQGAGCWARGLNDNREVTGTYLDHQGVTHGFYRDASANLTSFDPDGSTFTFANAINNSSQIAGYYLDAQSATHAFIRNSDGTFTTFDIAGATSLAAPFGFKSVSINDHGQTAGVATLANGATEGWSRSAAGVITISKPCGSDINSAITSVSILGHLVGYCGASQNLLSVEGWTF